MMENKLMSARSQAKKLGLKKYWSGRPCPHGHIGLRYTSCGQCVECYKRRTPEQIAWTNMIQRCENAKNPSYPNYGGKGVTICKGWRESFETFLADMGPRPPGLTLDRLDVTKGYSPANCRWLSWHFQTRNRRNSVHVEIDGREIVLTDAAKHLGLVPSTLRIRAKMLGSYQAAVDFYIEHGRQPPGRPKKVKV